MREKLLYYAYVYKGNYNRIKRAVEINEPWKKIQCDEKYITILDEEYPITLKYLKYPPWVLFYEGDLTLLKQRMIGVIGSRDCSSYGIYLTNLLIKHMNPEYGVISGLAKGIDGMAHLYACNRGRKTIAVLGCGLNVIYPKENKDLYERIRKHHLILSEYPKDTKPMQYHFPWRNRIIASLSEKLVVVESKVKSGTMITVAEALEINVPIYTFCHNMNNKNGEGCNLLIEQGCNMIKNIQDIKEL